MNTNEPTEREIELTGKAVEILDRYYEQLDEVGELLRPLFQQSTDREQ
jgi:hypothetical protein